MPERTGVTFHVNVRDWPDGTGPSAHVFVRAESAFRGGSLLPLEFGGTADTQAIFQRVHEELIRHPVTKLAKAGSTLNELVYGPDELFTGDPGKGKTRLTKVVEKLRQQEFDAYLFSGGGNDIAGPEFFSFINHAASQLPNPNREVLDGVVNGTFRKAYEDMIEVLLTEADRRNIKLPILVHGYDYPWPDGRGAVALGIIGPWFEDTFRKKGFPLSGANDPDLLRRRKIVAEFIKSLNAMLDSLQTKYLGKVFKVDLLGTLPNRSDWANELHPTNAGFAAVAWKFNNRLYEVVT